MRYFLNILISAFAIMIASYLLSGVYVESFFTGILIAIVLGLLNAVVKPILVLLTLPITIVTMGLFLWVINVIIIEIAAYLLDGFIVDGFWWAALFSMLITALIYIFYLIFDDPE